MATKIINYKDPSTGEVVPLRAEGTQVSGYELIKRENLPPTQPILATVQASSATPGTYSTSGTIRYLQIYVRDAAADIEYRFDTSATAHKLPAGVVRPFTQLNWEASRTLTFTTTSASPVTVEIYAEQQLAE